MFHFVIEYLYFCRLYFSLRKVKMDQRKLMEHQSTLVDMGKVIFIFIFSVFIFYLTPCIL